MGGFHCNVHAVQKCGLRSGGCHQFRWPWDRTYRCVRPSRTGPGKVVTAVIPATGQPRTTRPGWEPKHARITGDR